MKPQQVTWWRRSSNVTRPQLRWCWPIFASVCWLTWRGFKPLWMRKATTTQAPPLFSPEWSMQFAMGDQGCNLGRGSYMWRGHGLGSNINSKKDLSMHPLSGLYFGSSRNRTSVRAGTACQHMDEQKQGKTGGANMSEEYGKQNNKWNKMSVGLENRALKHRKQ